MDEQTTLVALSPHEVGPVQTELAAWCVTKMRALGQEYRELSANLRIAKRNRWSRGGLMTAVARTRKQIQYYQKIRKAVQAGFLIIPNFPLETIAIRVSRVNPPWKTGQYPSDVNTPPQEYLPAGVGRYVDEVTATTDLSKTQRDANGKEVFVRRAEAGHFREEVDFPIVAVKPIILEATARAMALKLFDRIGIANHGGATTSRARRRADPIVCGQILDPTRKIGWKEAHRVTFFIAWWLDTKSL